MCFETKFENIRVFTRSHRPLRPVAGREMPGLPGWAGSGGDRSVQYARIAPESKEPTYAYLEVDYGDDAWTGKAVYLQSMKCRLREKSAMRVI